MGGKKRDMDDYCFVNPLKNLLPKMGTAPEDKKGVPTMDEIEWAAFGKPKKKPVNPKVK